MTRLHPPFAGPDPERKMPSAVRRGELERSASTPKEAEDLPSIEQFLDEFPLIDDLLETPAESFAQVPGTPWPYPSAPELDEEGWAVADWQSYDWNRLASAAAPREGPAVPDDPWFGRGGVPAASFEAAAHAASGAQLPSEEVASALDAIARRIRSGELRLDHFQGTPPEAAIVAAFAALLKQRR